MCELLTITCVQEMTLVHSYPIIFVFFSETICAVGIFICNKPIRYGQKLICRSKTFATTQNYYGSTYL